MLNMDKISSLVAKAHEMINKAKPCLQVGSNYFLGGATRCAHTANLYTAAALLASKDIDVQVTTSKDSLSYLGERMTAWNNEFGILPEFQPFVYLPDNAVAFLWEVYESGHDASDFDDEHSGKDVSMAQQFLDVALSYLGQ